MNKYKKTALIVTTFAIVLACWIIGVAMGYSSAQSHAIHGQLIRHVIVLNHIESKEPESAANWSKTFIIQDNHYRKSKLSWVQNLRSYFRPEPTSKKFISDKVDQVVRDYKPEIIDFDSEIKNAFGPDVNVEIKIK